MPVMCGSTTQRVAEAAIAASTALPPSRKIFNAVEVASGCDVATALSLAWTGERPGSAKFLVTLRNSFLGR